MISYLSGEVTRARNATALLLLLSGLSLAQREQASKVLPQAALDEAIAALPPASEEAVWDEPSSNLIWKPQVVQLREHLAAGGKLSDQQWRRALTRSGAIHTRPRWPVSEPLAVSMEVPGWLGGPIEIRAKARVPGMKSIVRGSLSFYWCGNELADLEKEQQYQVLGPLPVGRHAVAMDVVVERGDMGSAEDRDTDPAIPRPGILWRGDLTLEVEIVPALDDVLSPVHGADLDAKMRSLFVAELRDTNVCLWGFREKAKELADCALSFDVDVLENDLPSQDFGHIFLSERVGPLDEVEVMVFPSRNLTHSSLRIRGTPKEVLHYWPAERYWDGEIVIPLSSLLQR